MDDYRKMLEELSKDYEIIKNTNSLDNKSKEKFLKTAINTYPNMDLYIDLHRDAATHKVSTTTINNKPCAKVLFVIGE